MRKVQLDYAGADGMPKPMAWMMEVVPGATLADDEQRAREVFHKQFPEWTLRQCSVGEEIEVEDGSLRPAADLRGIWLCG